MPSHVAASVDLLAWRLLEFYGIDPAKCFSKAGLDRGQLEHPDARISRPVSDGIWRCTQELIDDPCAGLNAARLWHPSTIGTLGYAMLASSTLRTSLQRMVLFQNVVLEESAITLTETDKGMMLRQSTARHQSPDLPILADVAHSFWIEICRFNYGDVLDPVEVNLRRPKPDCADRYYALYRCPVNFSADDNNLILPPEAMDRVLPNRNRQLARMHDQVLQRYLAQHRDKGLVRQVRDRIVDLLPSGNVSRDRVAETLHMSSRTLLRKLTEEGTSFAEILNETRRDLAIDYIRDDSLSLVEVSFLLGFSDSSAFSRAFKRWTGTTPAESRLGNA